MSNDIYHVDAFTDRPFSGNPAAVVPLTDFADDQRLQSIAAEMNLAETAFVVSRGGHFDLRWFSPTLEVDLCGHATLAAAHVLWETKRLLRTADAIFQTRSGRLVARVAQDGIELIFPSLPLREVVAPAGLIDSLGINPIYVGSSKFDYLVQVATAAEVRNTSVDFAKLALIETRGVIVTAVSDNPDYDFVSRFFAPAAGIDEDPATGSSHCVLGPFWQTKLGRSSLRAYQASARGGKLTLRVEGDQTHLFGRAITIIRGRLLV